MTDFTPPLKKLLQAQGYRFFRTGRGDHEIWRHDETGRKVVVDSSIVEAGRFAQGVLIRFRLTDPAPPSLQAERSNSVGTTIREVARPWVTSLCS